MLDEDVAIDRHDGSHLSRERAAYRATERELGAGALVVPRQRLVLVPDHALLLEPAAQRLHGRRRRGLREDAQPAVRGGLAHVGERDPERVERRALARWSGVCERSGS